MTPTTRLGYSLNLPLLDPASIEFEVPTPENADTDITKILEKIDGIRSSHLDCQEDPLHLEEKKTHDDGKRRSLQRKQKIASFTIKVKEVKKKKSAAIQRSKWTQEQEELFKGVTPKTMPKEAWKELVVKSGKPDKECRNKCTRQTDPSLIHADYTVEDVLVIENTIKENNLITLNGHIKYNKVGKIVHRAPHKLRYQILQAKNSVFLGNSFFSHVRESYKSINNPKVLSSVGKKKKKDS